MLLAGRTEVIVGDTDSGVAYYSRQLGITPGALRRVPIELYRSSLYIAFSRDSDDALVAAWAAALATLRRSGELTRIQRRYEQRDDQWPAEMSAPVIDRAPGWQRKNASSATSSGWMKRA
jgi:polar amino acid transport system substrate-binding protein